MGSGCAREGERSRGHDIRIASGLAFGVWGRTVSWHFPRLKRVPSGPEWLAWAKSCSMAAASILPVWMLLTRAIISARFLKLGTVGMLAVAVVLDQSDPANARHYKIHRRSGLVFARAGVSLFLYHIACGAFPVFTRSLLPARRRK